MERLNRAFTLIELMMVIVIVTVLLSVFLPVLASARSKVYQTQCIGNLRQIGVGISDYTDLYDGFSPPPELAPPYDHFLNYLYVEAFEQNPKPLQCPSVPEEQSFNPYGGKGIFGQLTRASYIMNAIRERNVNGWSYIGARISAPYSTAFGWCGGDSRTPIRQNLCVRPSEKIMITDAGQGLTNSSTAIGILRLHETDHGVVDSNGNAVVNAGERQIGFQHGFRFSALFGDFHTEARTSSMHDEWNAIQQ